MLRKTRSFRCREKAAHTSPWSGKSKLNEPWLNWHDGNIETKNPDEALIDKMVAIARGLGGTVQGDDGEIYHSGHQPPRHPQPSVIDRLRHWMRALLPARPLKPIDPPFRVGDRVEDTYHRIATVIEIDPKSNHGLGKVKVRYDDGREVSSMLIAPGFSPIQQAEKEN
jgi:hypothetical protein